MTPNDHCDPDAGSNHRQNWPVLTSVIKSGTDALVSGTLDSTPGHTFTIEFFATPDGVVFGSDDREGKRFLGQTNVTTAASPDCSTPFSETLSGVNDDDIITATATDITPDANGKPQNDTSEFSNPRQVIIFGQKVTGGGFIDPDATTDTFICNDPCVDPDPANPITRASFGVNAKYLAHFGTVPQGHTNFRARAQKLHLSSTAYEDGSLAVFDDPNGGQRFEWRGTGKLNGQSGYCFQVNGRDHQQNPPSTEQDKFRIRIWSPAVAGDCSTEGLVIYDNDSATTFTTGGTGLGGGNLEVHN